MDGERTPLSRERLAVIVGLGLVVAVVALAAAAGVGPFSGDDGTVDDFPTESTPSPTGGDDGAGAQDGGGGGGGASTGDDGTGTATEEPTPQRPFALRIDSIESCGQTCRDVTATLVNQQDQQATGVTVYTRIHEGQGTDGDVVWEGTHEVGTLATGASDTETQRVELSYFDALAVQQNGGWITIVTSIETDRQTVTFREQRDVT